MIRLNKETFANIFETWKKHMEEKETPMEIQ